MMAGIAAATAGAAVTLLEKNEKLGKKLYLTGKGRCNVTNATDINGLMKHTLRNPRFLHSAFHTLDSTALMAFLEGIGVPLKIERGNRVFPVSDKANDINRALEVQLDKQKARVLLRTAVTDISPDLTVRTQKGTYKPDALILATGGLSYPSTGATGEGFAFAQKLGHTVIPTAPSLVPLLAEENWLAALAGLSLKNVKLTARHTNGKVLYEELGEMLFTPEGISGPLVLKASAFLTDTTLRDVLLSIDLKPGLDAVQLDARLLRDFTEFPNKNFANVLRGLLPERLINAVVQLCGFPAETKVNEITRGMRQTLVSTLKNIPIQPTATAGYKEAVITRGGISTKEINPSTLMSKKIPGLFFAGENIDIDALTGGYNSQIAFSTGYLAGLSAAAFTKEK